ncbi:MAG: hypothetical protein WA081_18955 [Desulfosalsimonadaceae bacterium]
MKKIISIGLISITALLAAVTGFADLFEKNEVICATAACTQVHASSFSTVFGVPVGFYAAGLLMLALWLYLKKKQFLFAILLWALVGAEGYFTFLQIVFIRAFCTSCLIFFSLLIACVIVSGAFRIKTALMIGFASFFGAHFVLFFPLIQLKSTLMQNPAKPETSIEIFASPSCSHCEEAISELSGVCKDTGAALILRPVCISQADREKSVQWVSSALFQCGSATSDRLAEKIVWDNEHEARRLTSGELLVPLILIKKDGNLESFNGWDSQIKDRIVNLVAKADAGTRTATAGELTRFNKLQGHSVNLKNNGEICSKTSECHEKN